MKMFKNVVVLFLAFMGINQVFASGKLELVNSDTIDMNLVENLTVTYSEDNIVLLESNDGNLTLKEYMAKNRMEYYAKVEKSQDTVVINNGERPRIWKTARIEIYIPQIFIGSLNVALESGTLEANYSMNHRAINLSVVSGEINLNKISSANTLINISSGNIKINDLNGIEHNIKNKSGNIRIDNYQGKINVFNESGDIVVRNFNGEGAFEADSGNIHLTINDIIGDLSVFTDSGNIDLIMEKGISFILDAEIRSGNIKAPNGIRLERENNKVQQNIGIDPKYKIVAKCGSGNINIKQ